MNETFDQLRLEIIEKLVNNKITSFTYPGIGCTSVKGIVAAQSLEKLDLSNNRINDLSDIAQLFNLKALNLENNYVTELPDLHCWSKLTVLDLSGNCISSFDSVRSIAGLNSLLELKLSGNPVCTNGPNYRKKLFEMQNNLQVIDGWSRQEFLLDETQSSSADNQTSSDLALMDRIHSLERKAEALTNALELQEKSLSSQGPSVVKQANALGAGISTDGLLSKISTSSGGGSGNGRAGGTDASVTSIEKELVDSFPYFRLLSSWRKKVLHLMMTNKFLESDLVKAHQAQKREREVLFSKVCEMERLYLSQKEQNKALVQENAELRSRAEGATAQCAELQRAFQSVSGEHNKLVKQMVKVGAKLKRTKERDDQTAVESAVTLKHMLDKLVEYEARLKLSTERVSLTASTLSYQQIKLRNDRAALEAEKVQFQLRIARMKDRSAELKYKSTAGGKSGNSSDASVADSTSASNEGIAREQLRFLSDVQVDAEVEGTLKSIFQFLDESNRGLVSAQALLDLVLTPSMTPDFENRTAFLNYLIDRLVSTGVESLLASGDFFEPVGVELSQLMGSVTFARLLLALLCKVCDQPSTELTFGELLLQLMPDTNDTSRTHLCQVEYVNMRLSEVYAAQGITLPLLSGVRLSTDTRAALTSEELLKLQRAGLLGDQAWGVLPLVLPSLAGRTQSTSTSSATAEAAAVSGMGPYRSVSPTHRRDQSVLLSSAKFPSSTNEHTILPPPTQRQMQSDIERLSRERHHLLKMVQEMSRSLERRAEGIKWYFDAELKRAYHEINTLHQQDRANGERITTLEDRIQENQKAYAAFRETAESQNLAHNVEKAELMQKLAMRSTEEIRQYESELQERNAQYLEIQEKNKKLNDDVTKLNIKIGTLQRQLSSERAKYEKKGKEVATQISILRNQLQEGQERCVKIDSESRLKLEAAAEGWNGEKQQLLADLETKQRTIIEKNAEILSLQQSVAELKATTASLAAAVPEVVHSATNTSEEVKAAEPVDGLRSRTPSVVSTHATQPRYASMISPALNYSRGNEYDSQDKLLLVHDGVRSAKEDVAAGRREDAYRRLEQLLGKV